MSLRHRLRREQRASALGDCLRPGVQRLGDTGWAGSLFVCLLPDGRGR